MIVRLLKGNGDVCVGDGEALVRDGAWVMNDLSIVTVSPAQRLFQNPD